MELYLVLSGSRSGSLNVGAMYSVVVFVCVGVVLYVLLSRITEFYDYRSVF